VVFFNSVWLINLLTFLASTIYKEFSSGGWFGVIIYLSIIIFIWCFFFGILFSIGIEAFNRMVLIHIFEANYEI